MQYPNQVLHWINGREAPPASAKFFDKFNPATGKILAAVAKGEKTDADSAISSASRAFFDWSLKSITARANILKEAIALMREKRQELAEIVSLESGKPRKISLGEVDAAIKCGEFFISKGANIFANTEKIPSAVSGRKVKLMRQPIGAGALITPFNNPAAGIAWKLFPALLCGNSVVIKSHGYTPYIAVWYAKLFAEAGAPSGVINILQGSGGEVGAALVKDPRVKFVSLTGSLATGASILKNTADRLAKVSIEAGGKNPFVVLDDADLESAASLAVQSAFVDGGQRCAAASRVIVAGTVYNKFKKIFLDKISNLKIGTSDDCDYGAIISKERMERILKYEEDTARRGGKLLTEGGKIAGSGYFLRPAVFENIKTTDPIWREEIFGPVVVLKKAKNFEEALALANNSDFKLSGAIHTKNMRLAEEFVARYQSGVARVNGPTHGSEPNMPFGGIGLSGNGWREPGSKALDFYADWKQVSIDNLFI